MVGGKFNKQRDEAHIQPSTQTQTETNEVIKIDIDTRQSDNNIDKR